MQPILWEIRRGENPRSQNRPSKSRQGTARRASRRFQPGEDCDNEPSCGPSFEALISTVRPPVPHILGRAGPRPLLPPPGLERVLAHQRAVLGLGGRGVGNLEVTGWWWCGLYSARLTWTVLYTVSELAEVTLPGTGPRPEPGLAPPPGFWRSGF